MSSFELLIREHGELAAQVERLEALLKPGRPAVAKAIAERTILADLLDAHLAREDADVYPRLIGCRNAPTVHLAKSFQADFGQLVAAWAAYLRKWDAAAATRDWRGFCKDTAIILALLSARMRSENQLLYPAALSASVISLRDHTTVQTRSSASA